MRIDWKSLDGLDKDDLLHVRRVFYPPAFTFPMHDHGFPELFLVTAGSGWHDTPRGAQPLQAWDLVAVAPSHRHRLRADGRRSLAFINLALSPGMATVRQAAPTLWDGAQPRRWRLDPFDRQVLLDRLADLERPAGAGDRLAVEALLSDLVWRLARSARRSAATPPLVERALATLDEPDGLAAGPAAVARRAGCSREHLNRLCRRHLGSTLVDLVAARRLDHAARLLRHGDGSVAAVAIACGFASQAHFYTRFAARFNCTPAVWRRGGATAPA